MIDDIEMDIRLSTGDDFATLVKQYKQTGKVLAEVI
jgi:hypothetical protein